MFIYITHSDNQSFLANTDCPVLLLLSHLRSKVGVPPSEVIDLCDKLGSPKMLFHVKTMQDRASDFLPARGTYYVCRVEFGVPGTAQEQTAQSFVPLLKNPSVALTGGCRDGNAWGGVPSLGLLQKPPVPFLVQRRCGCMGSTRIGSRSAPRRHWRARRDQTPRCCPLLPTLRERYGAVSGIAWHWGPPLGTGTPPAMYPM
uniref:Chromosome X open reading frame 65 n=1 Tax=Meleagris gallopavo TaxID=9103 RepID=G1N8Y6_MELGA